MNISSYSNWNFYSRNIRLLG